MTILLIKIFITFFSLFFKFYLLKNFFCISWVILIFIADKYLSNALTVPNTVHGDLPKLPQAKENGLLSELNSYGYQPCSRNDLLLVASTSENSHSMDQRLEGSRKTSSITSLKELVRY